MGGFTEYLPLLVCMPLSWQLWGLLVGTTLITAVGILDDIYQLPAIIKLAGQMMAAIVVILFGIKITFVGNPFTPGTVVSLGILAAPLTMVWLVVVTNAVNLIDGLDGLASGTSFIASITMATLFALQTYHTGGSVDLVMVILPLIVAAATMGFLKYNFHPARIFLGDGGSMLLGFLMANIAVMGLAKSVTFISVMISLVIFGVPLMDIIFAVVRRFHKRLPIMYPDREHLHHRLLDLGFSHQKAVLTIYGVNTVLGGIAILLTVIKLGPALLLVEGVFLAAIVVANQLGIAGQHLRTKYLMSCIVMLYVLNIFIFFFPKF